MTDRPQPGEQPTPYRDADGRPRYGMLLPEGRDISEFIVPARPPGRAGAADRPGPAVPGAEPGCDARPAGPATSDPYATGPAAAGTSGPAGRPPGPYRVDDRRGAPGAARPVPAHGDPHGDPRDHPAERHRLRRRRRAVAAMILGLALMAAGPLTGAAVGVLRAVDGVGDVLGTGIRTTNGGSATLEAGVERQIYRTDGEALTQCTVTGPDGAEVATSVVQATGGADASILVPGILFTTADAGSYGIDCADVPAGTTLLVSPQLTVQNPSVAMAWVGGGLVVGALGLGALVWGVVVLRATRTPAWYRR